MPLPVLELVYCQSETPIFNINNNWTLNVLWWKSIGKYRIRYENI